jgi:Zn-dependent metalloprotease
MCDHRFPRRSIFCLVPPYVLKNIAQNGSREQRIHATETLVRDSTFRSLRSGPRLASDVDKKYPAALAVEGQKQRTIFDCRATQNLASATVVRAEGSGPTGDAAVNEAYDGLGATYDFFWDVFERNSIDDNGMALNGYVHFTDDYNNAFWDGQHMVFGDGDGDLFNRFTLALDVIAHELTHGVTEDEGRLIYFRQAGALNESISDVFGSLVKQRVLEQTADQADWLIGAALLTDEVEGVALRSMAHPGTAFDDPILGKDPQPAHMNDFVNTFEDNGGVHINSGIPNKAFCLVAKALGGYAWEKAGRIWYETLRDPRLKPNIGFRRFSSLSVANAVRLYGGESMEAQAVREGWAAVGLPIT